MSKYIRLSTLEYPLYEGDIRLTHPDIPEDLTYPNFPCPSEYAEVHGTIPEYDDSAYTIQELSPVLVNGVWQARYSEPEAIPPEVVEQRRMELLARANVMPPIPTDVAGEEPNVII